MLRRGQPASGSNVRNCRRPGDRARRPCVRSASSCQQGELDLWVAVQPHAKLIADWASSGFRMVLLSVAVVWGHRRALPDHHLSKDIMAHTASEIRIQSLRIRKWMHVIFCVLYVSAAVFCAIKQILVGVILLVVFAVVSGIVVRRSIAELSRLSDNEPTPAYGPSQQNMTPAQLQSRAHKLRLRTWASIVAAAIFTSGALFFVLRQNVIAALPLIGLTAISALIINRSAEELLRLREGEPEA